MLADPTFIKRRSEAIFLESSRTGKTTESEERIVPPLAELIAELILAECGGGVWGTRALQPPLRAVRLYEGDQPSIDS